MTTFWEFQAELDQERYGVYDAPPGPDSRRATRERVKKALNRLQRDLERRREHARLEAIRRKQRAEWEAEAARKRAWAAKAIGDLQSQARMAERLRTGDVYYRSSQGDPENLDHLARERIWLWNELVRKEAVPEKLPDELEGLKFMIAQKLWPKAASEGDDGNRTRQ